MYKSGPRLCVIYIQQKVIYRIAQNGGGKTKLECPLYTKKSRPMLPVSIGLSGSPSQGSYAPSLGALNVFIFVLSPHHT